MPKLPEMEEIKLSMGNEALNIPKKASRCQKELLFYQNHKYLFVSLLLQITLYGIYIKINCKLFVGLKMCKLNTGIFKHFFAGFYIIRIFIFITYVYNFFDSALNNSLGTFITWEKCNINSAPFKTVAACI